MAESMVQSIRKIRNFRVNKAEYEVFCAWNPNTDLLAHKCSGNVEIWDLNLNKTDSGLWAGEETSDMCPGKTHQLEQNTQTMFYQCFDWNQEGTYLCTGSDDGDVRIWKDNGTLYRWLKGDKDAISHLKWNRSGSHILGVTFGDQTIIWGSSGGQLQQKFSFYRGMVKAVDWKDNNTFASISHTSSSIFVGRIGIAQPVKVFNDTSTNTINAMKWDPQGRLLASSCGYTGSGSDGSVKLWSMDQMTPIRDLRAHKDSVCFIRWSPSGLGTANPNSNVVLATISPSAIRLWDVEKGCSTHLLEKSGMFNLAFSPDGKLFATPGPYGTDIMIWSTTTGTVVDEFATKEGISSLSWNHNGNKIAAGTKKGTVVLLDMRKIPA